VEGAGWRSRLAKRDSVASDVRDIKVRSTPKMDYAEASRRDARFCREHMPIINGISEEELDERKLLTNCEAALSKSRRRPDT
jgi:hypothetical protein